jgi:hypothetical protein
MPESNIDDLFEWVMQTLGSVQEEENTNADDTNDDTGAEDNGTSDNSTSS